MAKKRGRIFVISSPSGGGKTTVCNRLKKGRFDIEYSVSATTRRPRPKERNGRDYYFLKKRDFERLINQKRFLEWTDNFGKLYGTPAEFVKEVISKGRDIMLSIDVKGAMQVKKIYKDAVLIFLLPPSKELLKRRLKRRKTEGKQTLARRLKIAQRELGYMDRYDYAVVNDNLAKAVDALRSIIVAERNRIKGK